MAGAFDAAGAGDAGPPSAHDGSRAHDREDERTQEMASVSDSENVMPVESAEPDPFTPEIQRVNLVHGRFQFLDEKLQGRGDI